MFGSGSGSVLRVSVDGPGSGNPIKKEPVKGEPVKKEQALETPSDDSVAVAKSFRPPPVTPSFIRLIGLAPTVVYQFQVTYTRMLQKQPQIFLGSVNRSVFFAR